MKTISKKLISTLLVLALAFGLFVVLPLCARAAEEPFQVTENPVGAIYLLNQTAVPIQATFQYDALAELGTIDSAAPITVQWYWSQNNSNTGRSNGFGEKSVEYSRKITHMTTLIPATNVVGVRYYYAVLSYNKSVAGSLGQWESVRAEAVTEPARIEVIAPGAVEKSFMVKKVDEEGKPLAGAVFLLVPEDDKDAQDLANRTYEATSKADGNATFTAVEGVYMLSEKQSPVGYSASDEKYKITVNDDGVFINKTSQLETYDTLIFVNKKIPASATHDFTVKKSDEKGVALAGATIRLEGLTGDGVPRVYNVITDNKGEAKFTVEIGTYELSEYAAPQGYNATDTTYKIVVTTEGVFIQDSPSKTIKYAIVTFINKEIPTLNKKDHFAYMQGYPEGDFRPTKNMTRAEAVVMFSRLLTESMNVSTDYRNSYYPDIVSTKWYANQVGYMQQLGVLVDYTRDSNFRPDIPVTRAEFATLAAHFDNLILTNTNNFSDVATDHWAVKYINSAAAKGWIIGNPDGTFKPEALITRAEVVTLVNRMLERVADSAYLTANLSYLPRIYTDLATAYWGYLAIMEASTGHDYTKDGAGEHWSAVYE
ncbi:MAG: S-layer homology domain-containing protein [Firmicutes bacterium]|nr:S-layer homology domain-containing protein [Bacillota bacterium]